MVEMKEFCKCNWDSTSQTVEDDRHYVWYCRLKFQNTHSSVDSNLLQLWFCIRVYVGSTIVSLHKKERSNSLDVLCDVYTLQ